MMRRRVVVACCVLLSGAPMLAQSRSAAADPLSGTWTGAFVLANSSDPVPITMELKFDGKRTVSGSASGLPNPADVKAGTFDPKTGELKLRLGIKGEDAVLLTLEGTVVKRTATGHISGERTGDFSFTKKS